jgi:anti-repressor protein
MNVLLAVKPTEDGREVVSARDLHAALEVARDFSTWIKDRIEKYNFLEGNDFEVFTKSGENPLGGRPSLEYSLSVSMAKELATVENNDKGREVRRYLIQVEEAWNSPEMVMERARQASEILISRMRARLAIAEPKAAYADEISNSEGGIPLSDFAHVLAGKGWEIGRTRLFRLLISSGILYESYLPNLKKKISRPYQTQIEAGRFLVHEVAVKAMNALYPQVLITPKGQKYVIDHLVEWEVKRLVRENGSREVVV